MGFLTLFSVSYTSLSQTYTSLSQTLKDHAPYFLKNRRIFESICQRRRQLKLYIFLYSLFFCFDSKPVDSLIFIDKQKTGVSLKH
jgi:hypothetical protein